MRIRLALQVFLAMLAFALLAVALMAALLAWNVRAGFADYLLARDEERLDRLVAIVAADVRRQGTDVLRRPAPLRRYLREFADAEGDPPPPPPPPPPPRRDEAPAAGSAARPAPGAEAPAEPPLGPPPKKDGKGAPLHPGSFAARVMLLDPDGQPLAPGRAPAAGQPVLLRPVTVDGRTLALARLIVDYRTPQAVDARFLRRQYLGIAAVAGVLFGGALLGAWWAGRRWVAPLRAAQAVTHRLARGDFAARLPVPNGGDEVAELARDVNALADALQRLESARRRWIAELTHELRTPLSVLRGELEALQDGIRPLSAAAIDSLQAEVAHLARLVADLHELALSDLNALPCTFAATDAGQCVRRALARVAARAAERGLTLEQQVPAGPLPVHWDSGRIEQLLGNLLENALRYTDAPGRVRVTLAPAAGAVAPAYELRVEDSAPGVAAADLPRLFDPLYRADPSRSRASGGSGLGLAICEAIVRAHGGSIVAAPAALGGLAIAVRLPAEGGA